MKHTIQSIGALLALGLAACAPEESSPPVREAAEPATNRIQVPASVRRNLGIEYVAVERRRVAATQRYAGHFELLASARHEVRTPIAGRVELLVAPLQRVAVGDVLYRIDSLEWRQMQRELGELSTAALVQEARGRATQPLLEAHRAHEESLREAIGVMDARATVLEEMRESVGGQARELAEARVQRAQVRSDLAQAIEQRVGVEASLLELESSLRGTRDRFELALVAASTILSKPAGLLSAPVSSGESKVPLWRSITLVEIRSAAAGVVSEVPVANGVWVEAGERLLTLSDLSQVRFRARAPQSDLASLREGLPSHVALPQRDAAASDRVSGVLRFGVEADPQQRTFELFLEPASSRDWMKPGVAGFLEIEARSEAPTELAIPLSAVLQDGLRRVYFRRDPADPDQVIRVEADLGADDGRWIEVQSGLMDGDEVVLAGAYELMLASSDSASKGGHFHADGTFHEGEEK
ncbi:MAG: efflux RND transporter periplasmic adaptor subunit [Planctomycetes bacterium]|nr:efflux RND transporter periplasmic adaptor subunit [Planctomycetota bacterium]